MTDPNQSVLRRKWNRTYYLLSRRDVHGLLHGVAGTLPGRGRWFCYRRLIVLRLRHQKVFRRYGGVRFCRVAEDDIETLAQCLGRSQTEYYSRLARGDIGFLAEAGESAVSTTWLSLGKYRLAEVDYAFDPGDHGVFLYDAYTVPEWRLKGIHTNLLKFICNHLREQSISDIYCAVEHGNDLSLRTHLRFGFVAYQTITYVQLGGLHWHLVRTVARSARADSDGVWGPVTGAAPSTEESATSILRKRR